MQKPLDEQISAAVKVGLVSWQPRLVLHVWNKHVPCSMNCVGSSSVVVGARWNNSLPRGTHAEPEVVRQSKNERTRTQAKLDQLDTL